MSLFRASRLLLSPARLAVPRVPRVAALRHKSTDAAPQSTTAVAPKDDSRGVSNASTAAAPEAPTDGVTSVYSPVVGHPQERSSTDVLAANVISQAPVELQSRTVRIYKPAKNATQSGHWNGHQWRMDWDILPRGHRWENPLMGWQSSADFMQGTHIFFKTKEDAIHFAEKQGYDYFVQEPTTRDFRVKSYAANFLHSPKKLKLIRTK